jgi:ribosomal-protein-alanine N-acetyltransferase
VGLGCLWAIVDEAHITLLLVHPDHRRRGLGGQILGALLQAAQGRSLSWATLEVGTKNQGAIALYEAWGFERVGIRKGYYQKTGEDALILWRKFPILSK